jgi:putative transposase
MKRSKFTEQQIVFALKQSETGIPVAEVCRKIGISEATFFNWKRKFSGLGTAELRRLRQLEDETVKLFSTQNSPYCSFYFLNIFQTPAGFGSLFRNEV